MEPRWLLVIPPEGAARQAALDLSRAALHSPQGSGVKVFDTKPYLDGFAQLLKKPDDDMRVDLMNQALVVSALDHSATSVLVTALAPVTAFTANLLRKQTIKVFHWFIEDARQALYWRQVLPAYDGFFSIQVNPIQAACIEAGCRFALLPTALSPELSERPFKPWAERDLDFAFVGLPSPYRLAVLEALLSAGARLAVGGLGWDRVTGPLRPHVVKGESMPPHEAFALMERAQYALHAPYEDPSFDRANTHVSPRIYDALGLGCHLICEDAPLLREGLQGYAVTFAQGPQGLAAAWKKTAALTVKGQLPESAQSNRQRVLTHDSYMQRWQRLQELVA